MHTITIEELDILDIGNTIQLGGAIWTGQGRIFLVPLPDESLVGDIEVLRMDADQWERFLNQSDLMDVRGPGKAILRKSQRQIDQAMSWRVYKRDGYVCRYCGREMPLTVDHIILWESGGATVEDNLLAACRRCNKLRGNMEYEKWIESPEYIGVSGALSGEQLARNLMIVGDLDHLRSIKAKPRSR